MRTTTILLATFIAAIATSVPTDIGHDTFDETEVTQEDDIIPEDGFIQPDTPERDTTATNVNFAEVGAAAVNDMKKNGASDKDCEDLAESTEQLVKAAVTRQQKAIDDAFGRLVGCEGKNQDFVKKAKQQSEKMIADVGRKGASRLHRTRS